MLTAVTAVASHKVAIVGGVLACALGGLVVLVKKRNPELFAHITDGTKDVINKAKAKVQHKTVIVPDINE